MTNLTKRKWHKDKNSFIVLITMNTTSLHLLMLCLCVLVNLNVFPAKNENNNSIYCRADDAPMRKDIFVVGDRAFAPYEFINSKGEPDGFNIDIFKIIAKKHNWTYNIGMYGYVQCQTFVNTGEADLLLGIISPANKNISYAYSDPVSIVNMKIVTSDKFSFKTTEQLNGKEVIMKEGGSILKILNSRGIYPKPIYVDNMDEGLTLLSHGPYGIAICDKDLAIYYIKRGNLYNLTIQSPNLNIKDLRFMALQKNKALMDTINTDLAELRLNGEYERVYNKWFGMKPTSIPFMSKEGYMILLGVMILLLVVCIFTWLYKHKLRIATKELEDIYKKEAMELRKVNAIMDALPIGVALYNKEGIQVYINDSIATSYGITDLKSHKARELSVLEDPQVPKECKEKIRNCENFDVTIPYDLRKVAKDNYFETSYPDKFMYIDVKVRFVKNEADEVENIVIVLNDITEKHKLTSDLNESKQQLTLALNAGLLRVWQYDIKKDLIHTLYRENDDFEGLSCKEFSKNIYADDVAIYENALGDIMSGATTHNSCCIRIYDNKDGGYRYYKTDMMGFKDPDGEVIKVIGTSHDVTSEKLHDEEIININKTLELVIANAKVDVWQYDIEMHTFRKFQNGRFEDNNRGHKELANFVAQEDKHKFKEGAMALLSGEKSTLVINYKEQDCDDPATYRYKECILYDNKDNNGKRISVIALCSDVTARQQMIEHQQGMIRSLDLAMSTGNIYAWYYNAQDKEYKILYGEVGADINTNMDHSKERRIHPDDAPKYSAFLQKCLNNHTNQKESVIVRFWSPLQNKYLFHEVAAHTQVDVNNKPIGLIGVSKDITDVIREKDNLEKLKIQYETMFNSLDIGAVIRDNNGNLLHFNKSYSNILGISDEDWYLKNKTILDNTLEIPDIVREALKKKLVTKFTIPYDFDKIKEGHYYETYRSGIEYISIKISPLVDSHGITVGTLELISDVTSEINSQKLIEEEQLRTQLAIKASKIILWEYDVKAQEFNIKDYKFAPNGKAKMDVFYFMMSKADRPKLKEIEKLLNLGINQSFSIDVKYKTPDDEEWHYGTLEANPFEFDKNGKCIKYAGYRRDNTSMVKLNQEVMEYGERLNYILTHNQIYTWDYYPDKKVLIMTSKNDFESQERIIPDEDHFNQIDEGDREEVKEIYHRMDNLEENDYKIVFRRTINGKMHYMEINGIPIHNEDGNITKYSGLCKDITEMMEVQRSLEAQKEKALQADKLKSAFLANMSHEIRTPLNAIIGFSELLQDSEDPEDRKEYIKIINTNNELLLQLINDILDLSKIEAGVMDFHYEIFEFSQFFDDICRSLQQRLINPDVRFIVGNPHKPFNVNLDKTRISQVIINFGVNAMKYTSQGFIKIGYELQQDGLYIFVTDSGTGISEENTHRLFARFEKLGSFVQGTGLGLAISKAIMNELGGTIGCDSKEGEGSTFWIKLPLKYIVLNK